jgi:hypothetical protein
LSDDEYEQAKKELRKGPEEDHHKGREKEFNDQA